MRTLKKRCTALLGAGLLAIGAPVLGATPAAASCLASTEQKQYDDADLVVEGTFDEGPSDENGALLRPASFDVARYVKGSGPERLEVLAGGHPQDDGSVMYPSVDILPRAGEAWRL